MPVLLGPVFKGSAYLGGIQPGSSIAVRRISGIVESENLTIKAQISYHIDLTYLFLNRMKALMIPCIKIGLSPKPALDNRFIFLFFSIQKPSKKEISNEINMTINHNILKSCCF
jgi:hypothetical protein